MKLPFVKMQGIGNDFIMIDTVADGRQAFADAARDNAVMLCDRKFGIGGDGVIIVSHSEEPSVDFRMVMYNPDGSEAEMCGNGIRCFAKFVYDRGYTRQTELRIITGRGVLLTNSRVSNSLVQSVQVDMGAPILARQDIPANLPGNPGSTVIAEPLVIDGRPYNITCVSMGNPHCIVFVDDVESIPLREIGPKFEHHPAFPKRINTEFIQVLNRSEFKMRVWERGAGETLACGTGACAAAVACALNDLTGRQVTGHLAGGDLGLDWSDSGTVLMTGPAAEVYAGVIEVND